MHHHPKKRLGQHFLSDQSVVHRIVSALSPEVGDRLVEIGPGQGALTAPVLRIAKQLDVIELDHDVIPQLKERCHHSPGLRVHQGDVLQFDFASLHHDAHPIRVFGNLPYNISTPLIFHLLTYANIISDMVFMLQKEVALRLAAQPNTPDYGRLSVMVQYHCDVTMLFDVSKHSFFPPPNVESSIISLVPYRERPYIAVDEHLLEKLVKHAFAHRRKTLRNNLRDLVEDAMWEAVSILPSRRAESLTVAEFVSMANYCHEHGVHL